LSGDAFDWVKVANCLLLSRDKYKNISKLEGNEMEEKNMMTRLALRFSIVAGVLILLATFTVLAMGTLSSEEVYAQSNCTLKTIQGTYIFEAQGVITDAGEARPYAEAGIWTLDGAGKAAGFISIGINGENFVNREVFTAEYELVSDCVYKVTDQFDLVVDLYTTRMGSTITYYSPGFSGTMWKQ
jgi:hypothetical protein